MSRTYIAKITIMGGGEPYSVRLLYKVGDSYFYDRILVGRLSTREGSSGGKGSFYEDQFSKPVKDPVTFIDEYEVMGNNQSWKGQEIPKDHWIAIERY